MCWKCGKPVTAPDPIGRSARCPDCGKDLRVCKNCRFYAPGASGNCSEPQGERPADPERATFCDWFSLNPKFRSAGAAPGGPSAGEAQAARDAFDSLFGGGG